ncbi:MAG TPA: thiamine pyrophosphate-binding protein [Deltaproteobacteria bacterium]|nr:thiamine pyrophosphate-binding protein [Deltaproteobacteria bacterium]HPJ92653.1 thiamine pyrophosphate-binding protein [Deltaproteobacteria bacterium]HPR55211.1 thiamine pyrophosphate-binding protein [Deltaproteobacteria bacterium]
MKLSDYVLKFIATTGVKHIFMLSGGGAMHLVDSAGRNRDLTYICNLHEQACAIAAEAYGQYTNNLGVALVTTGPGGTNTITGVAGAWLDSTPMLIISGQVKRPDMVGDRGVRQMGFQEIDIISIVRPITKYAVTVLEPSSIRYHLEKAVYLARHGRPGPVWVDIPLDVQAAEVDEHDLLGFDDGEMTPTSRDEHLAEKVHSAIELLNQAERPVILAGNGIRLARAQDDFQQLIGTLGIPVLTTWKAADFLPDDHPLNVGRPGAVGQRGANFTQQNADWILVIGARLDLGQTAYTHENFAPHAHKIMVDIDSAEIIKMRMKIHVPIIADAGDFIRELNKKLSQTTLRDHASWVKQCKKWQKRYPVVLPEYWHDTGFVNDYVLIDVLSDELSGKDLLVPGSSGACSERTMQAVRAKAGLRIFNTQGLGSMGFGISAAIGGCIASGQRRTVSIEGDGGFIMNIQELETVKRLNLPIKFFVLNNGGYVSIQTTQKNYFAGHYVGSSAASGLTLPDIQSVARSFGLATTCLKNHDDIREKIRDILQTPVPVVCEVMVSSDQVTAPRVASRQRKDGGMETIPMEDLWPFLDRQELKSNMVTFSRKGE